MVERTVNKFEAFIPELGMMPLIYSYNNEKVESVSILQDAYVYYGQILLNDIRNSVLMQHAIDHHKKVLLHEKTNNYSR